MDLRDFFAEDTIGLNLTGDSKDAVLQELIGLLKRRPLAPCASIP